MMVESFAPYSSDQPAVSVIMPVYNAERYLGQAVNSVLGQTFDAIELIVVDDGSNDGSLEMLQACAERDARVRVSSRPNTGIVGALNDGIAAASAPLLARMDADDVCAPTRLERQVAYMDAHPECVALGTRARFVCPRGVPLHGSNTHTDHDEIERRLLAGDGHGLIHPTAMIRREALARIGGYREAYRYVEDIDLFLRLARVGVLANLDEELLDYRVHLESTNSVRAQTQAELVRRLINEARADRGMSPLADAAIESRARSSPPECLQKWGWNALRQHRRWIAMAYGFHAWRRAPGSLAPLRLMACALRGY